jgi:small GTP-binding protein
VSEGLISLPLLGVAESPADFATTDDTSAFDGFRPSQSSSTAHRAALPHLKLVVVGHVGHGKSTLIGRLLCDTQSMPEGKAERIKTACKAMGVEFEYAFLLDELLEEWAQNTTMDTTRVPLRTARRAFTIIDAPGRKEFLQNVIADVASADAAILMVDASEGLRQQTRRHAYILSFLGVKQVVVAVNKMDLVGFDEGTFDRIRSELVEYLEQLDVRPAHFIPIAAEHGNGLLQVDDRTPWYRGPALIEALEQFPVRPVSDELAVTRGPGVAASGATPAAMQEFTARVFWLHPEELKRGDTLALRLGTQQGEASLVAINRLLDSVTLSKCPAVATDLRRYEVAEMRLRVLQPARFDAGGTTAARDRLVLLRNRCIAGVGMISAAVVDAN